MHLKYILFASALYLMLTGCAKEYSFEGGNNPIRVDTVQPPVIPPVYICPVCPGNENFQENKWSLRDDTLLRCGIIDTAVVNPERTGFTFFGPSACSQDTGLIMTVILDTVHLNRDLSNITSRFAAFYYYDNVGQTYIYMSKQQNPFTVIIDSYNHQSRLASGTFSGFGFKPAGGGSPIRSGKWSVKLH